MYVITQSLQRESVNQVYLHRRFQSGPGECCSSRQLLLGGVCTGLERRSVAGVTLESQCREFPAGARQVVAQLEQLFLDRIVLGCVVCVVVHDVFTFIVLVTADPGRAGSNG